MGRTAKGYFLRQAGIKGMTVCLVKGLTSRGFNW